MGATARRTLLAVAILLAGAVSARATQYDGWGDTGWGYASKRECCHDAIVIAQQYSAQACVTAGGTPRPPMGAGQRGVCTSQWLQAGDGSISYRCYGEASVWCR